MEASETTEISHQAAPGPIMIDLGAVLKSRLGARARLVPRWLVARLESLICQDQLNALLRYAWPRRGAAFCRAVVEHLGVEVDVCHAERLPDTGDRRVIFVSNHPLGALDGLILIALIASRYGCEPRFVVNDLLMAVEPLRDVFLPVNKHGRQSRRALGSLEEAMRADVPVIIFPAGLCSRLGTDGRVADLQWRKMFVQKAREYGRTIVPLHFSGANSDRFYRAARTRTRLHIGFNFEMLLLPSEIFKARGKTFTVTVGEPITPAALSRDTRAEVARIRSIVDSLNPDCQ